MKHRASGTPPTVRRAARRAGVIAAIATAAAAVTGALVAAAAVVAGLGYLPVWLDSRLVAVCVAVVLMALTVGAVRPLRAVHRAVERWAVRRGAAATIRHLDSLDRVAAGDEVERYVLAALARHDVDVVAGLLTVMRRYDPDRAAGLAAAMVVHVLADDGVLTVGGRHSDEGKGDDHGRPAS